MRRDAYGTVARARDARRRGGERSGALRRGALAACAGAALLLLGGCEREPDHGPGLRIVQMLRALPDSGGVLTLMSGDTLWVSPATVAYYRERMYDPAWTKGEELLPRGRAVYEVLGRAGEDGLSPARYGHDVATALIAAWEADNESDDDDVELEEEDERAYLGDLDVLLTEGFGRYANHLVSGTIDPEQAGLDWRIPRGRAPAHEALDDMVRGVQPAKVVEALRPRVPYYPRYRDALARYLAVQQKGGWDSVPTDAALAQGDSGAAVSALRSRLMRGADPREAELASAGRARAERFDEQLAEALKHFQRRHGILDDGVLGARTAEELNHSVEDRIAELKLNMDRWRWLPSELGDLFVLVNVAGFELEVVEDGKAIESMNVVVGQTGWNTPIFADTMEYLVVNPYWNVPTSIFEDEIRPAMERDPSYLQRNHMVMDEGRVRQLPGPWNALGKYKFLFPNANNIYLHDTPADHLFSRTERAFSHGCIRLERPDDLARLVMEKAGGGDASRVEGLLASGREQWVRLERDIPVYILYFTAWVQEDGTVRFHHDVYGRDQKLEQQRRERLEERPPAARVAARGAAAR